MLRHAESVERIRERVAALREAGATSIVGYPARRRRVPAGLTNGGVRTPFYGFFSIPLSSTSSPRRIA